MLVFNCMRLLSIKIYLQTLKMLELFRIYEVNFVSLTNGIILY